MLLVPCFRRRAVTLVLAVFAGAPVSLSAQQAPAAQDAEVQRVLALAKRAEATGQLRTALRHYQAAFARTGGNDASGAEIRERMLRLAGRMRPQPPVPEEAKRHLARGQAALDLAKAPADFEEAVTECKRAIEVAPWWPEAYFNLGKAQQEAKQYDDAIASFRLYLIADSKSPRVEEASSRIYKIEYAKEFEQKEAQRRRAEEEARRRRQEEQEAAERERRHNAEAQERARQAQREAERHAMQALEGRWRNKSSGVVYTVTVRDNEFQARGAGGHSVRGRISGSTISGTFQNPPRVHLNCNFPSWEASAAGTIR